MRKRTSFAVLSLLTACAALNACDEAGSYAFADIVASIACQAQFDAASRCYYVEVPRSTSSPYRQIAVEYAGVLRDSRNNPTAPTPLAPGAFTERRLAEMHLDAELARYHAWRMAVGKP